MAMDLKRTEVAVPWWDKFANGYGPTRREEPICREEPTNANSTEDPIQRLRSSIASWLTRATDLTPGRGSTAAPAKLSVADNNLATTSEPSPPNCYARMQRSASHVNIRRGSVGAQPNGDAGMVRSMSAGIIGTSAARSSSAGRALPTLQCATLRPLSARFEYDAWIAGRCTIGQSPSMGEAWIWARSWHEVAGLHVACCAYAEPV